jgi:hypothetical protein
MRILTICERGINRSVHLAWLLKFRGRVGAVFKHEVIPIGPPTLQPDTLTMLYDWADVIIITDKRLTVPDEYQAKVKIYDVGPDTYKHHFNGQLLEKLYNYIQGDPAFNQEDVGISSMETKPL